MPSPPRRSPTNVAVPVRATRDAGREPSPTTVLRGNTGHGSRAVFARAAKIAPDPKTGRSTLAPDLLELAAKQAKRGESVEIVLVTGDAHHSLLMPIPEGLLLAGVVAEWETDPRFQIPPDLSVVAGVAGAGNAVPEGEWLIVDPQRLRVIVAPDAGAVGRLQHRARARYRLGLAQEVATTLSGTAVPVWARVFTLADLEAALEAGADGFVVDGHGDFLPWDVPPGEPDTAAFNRLLPVLDAAGGGDVALLAPLDALDGETIVRIAALCRLCLLVSPESLPLAPLDLRAEFDAIASDITDAGRLAGVPRLTVLLSEVPPAESVDADTFRGYDEAAFLPFDADAVQMLSVADVLQAPPLRVFVPGASTEEIEAATEGAVFAGATGLIVAPEWVAAAKAAVAAQE